MDTPWDAHPEIQAGRIGWRMGYGEGYLMTFWEWFNQLSPDDQARFKDEHPEPKGWSGFYSSWHGS